MRLSIAQVLETFKRKWPTELCDESIRRTCVECGMKWRNRLLDPVTTTHLFLLQILHGNTAINHLRHLSGTNFTASAYCRARKRLPPLVLERLFEKIRDQIGQTDSNESRWQGHRVFIVDGTSCSMPDTKELQKNFGHQWQQKPGCSFPTAHLLSLVHAGTGLVQQVLSSPLYTHDMKHAHRLHLELAAGDLLIGDRAFCAFSHFCLLIQRQVHALFRLHQSSVLNPKSETQLRKVKTGRGNQAIKICRDRLVQWDKYTKLPNWLTKTQYAAFPAKLPLRVIHYQLLVPGFRSTVVSLITTLLDKKAYPARRLAELYGMRWSIETTFHQLKSILRMDILKCRSIAGIRRELLAYLIVYNLVRSAMINSASIQNIAVSRISFVDALRFLASHFDDPSILLRSVPFRPFRFEPRLKKRRPKNSGLLSSSRRSAKYRILNSSQIQWVAA